MKIRMKGFTAAFLSLAMVFAITPLYGQNIHANSNLADPSYEIKVFMDPGVVLNNKNKLKNSVRSQFNTGSGTLNYNVQFLDTNDQDLRDEGWSIRIRKREDQGTHRVQYKKRYPVTNGDIQGALQDAALDGFDSNTNFEAEVDWGYSGSMTLSFQLEERENLSCCSKLTMPDLNQSKQFALDWAPAALTEWSGNGLGTAQINNSRIYGPVYFERYIGEFQGKEIKIEIWHMQDEAGSGTEYIVEASMKIADHSSASAIRDELIAFIDGNGWLLPQDVLKTSLIMERY